SVAGARQILAHLRAVAPPDVLTAGDDRNAADALRSRHEVRLPLLVRPLRRLELPAINALHEQCITKTYGTNVRSEAYWEWLMSRHGFERAYVAILGDHYQELPELLASVVGCAFVSGSRIVELIARPGGTRAVELALVARVCSDVLERSQSNVRLDAPPQHSLHH